MFATILRADPALAIWYLFWVIAIGGLAATAYIGYRRRKDDVLGWLSWLLMWIAIDLLARVGLRSPWLQQWSEFFLHVGRLAPMCWAAFGFLTLDTYFARHNGHLDLPRRALRWWDHRSQRWEERQHT